MDFSDSAPIVVTGANGLVGSRVCRELSERGAPVRAVVRRAGTAPDLNGVTEVVGDFFDPDLAAMVCEGARALITTVHPLGGDDDEQRSVAVEGTPVIVRAARDAGVRLHVHVSTAAVYERVAGVGDVDEHGTLVPDGVDNVYALTKRDTDAAIAGIDGLTRVLVRPPAIVGSAESSVWNVVRPQGIRDDPQQRIGHPDLTWAWVHVEDLARLIVEVALGEIASSDDPDQGPVEGACTAVNACAPRATVRDYLGTVCDAFGVEPSWTGDDGWRGALLAGRAERWGWSPRVTLASALDEITDDARQLRASST